MIQIYAKSKAAMKTTLARKQAANEPYIPNYVETSVYGYEYLPGKTIAFVLVNSGPPRKTFGNITIDANGHVTAIK